MKYCHRLLVVLCVVLVCISIGISLSAQDRVVVTVSATAAGDAPIMTLGKADFTVQESGKPRALTTFVSPEAKPAAPPQLQPNEFSNLPDFREASGAIFVVLDTSGTRYSDERDSRPLILKFLGKAAQAKHAVTLGILSNKGLHLYHDYRTGSDVLLAALIKAGLGGMKGVSPPPGVNEAEVTAEAARLMAFSKGDLSNATPDLQLLRAPIDLPLTMFQDVGFASEGLPGRKSLVWMTNAVPFDIDPKTMQFKSPQIAGQGVAVSGLTVGGAKDALTPAEIKRITPIWRQAVRAVFDGGVAVYPVEVNRAATSASSSFTQQRMKELALLTGGKAFYGSNDPFPDILQSSTGNTAGYELGYSTDANTSPDFRRLEVTVNQPNVQVNHPAGFFPYEGTPKSRATDEIGIAMTSPLEYTGIRFKVAVTGIEDGAGGKKKINLLITLPGNAGILNEATGTVDVGFLAVAANAKGEKVGNMNEGAGGKFPPEAVAQIKEMGFQLKRSFEASPGECNVRFLVRDNQTGRMGDVFFPLTVK
ncbi:MAG TPA: VWA domain-containing protein [Terriglobales bacterium]